MSQFPPPPLPQPAPFAPPSRASVLSTLPLEPVAYHQMLRTPRARWWKALLAIVLFVIGYLILSAILQLGAVGIDVATGRVESSALLEGKLTLTPTLLLSVNLTNACAIPLSMLLQRLFWGQRGRWLHSVTGVIRWRLMARSLVIVLPVWVLYVVIGALTASPQTPGAGLTTESIVLLVIVVLTTPLQAAGEEYGARGLLNRAAGSWVANPRTALILGTLLSSALFMVAHGAGDPWLIVFYFLFGVGLSLVTWRTGGLEVAVVIHTVNNVVLFGVSILSGQDLSAALDRSNGTGGPEVLIPMAMLVVMVAGVWWLARRTGVVQTFRPEAAPMTSPAPPIALG
ncbi:MAG TPA: CPBP family intramembrane glutamic endopeptidase [Propionibacteriaceae bacterium]